MPRCRMCKGWWSEGGWDEPAYGCDCTPEELEERAELDARERDEDDGSTYADPRDEMERRLLED